jgi:beta-phosphoglucomutase-like phosphatase (HAD superfamily)
MSELRAVLWDLDGTLVDSEGYWMAEEFALSAEFGGKWTDEDALAVVGNDLIRTGQALAAKGVDLPPEAIVERLLGGVIGRMRHTVPWRPGARELLGELAAAGVANALVTMSYRDYADAVAAALPAGSFAAIVPGDEVGAGKPDPECYLRAVELLGVPAGGCVVLEDSVNGIGAAVASGLTTVAIPFMVPVPEVAGMSRVASLEELDVPLLRQIAAGRVLRTA